MQLKERLRDAGIVGAGGAGFPSYGKLSEGADTLIINAAECEPLLYTDLTLLEHHLDEVGEGASLLMDGMGIREGYLAIKLHRAEYLGLTDGQQVGRKVKVKIIPSAYPMGDEINQIYQVTGRLVQPGNLPISVGVIVYNCETVYNIYKAFTSKTPLTEKWVMIAGDIPVTYCVRVPVGTRVADLLAYLQVEVPKGYEVIEGGPSMGGFINPRQAVITKTTKGLCILPPDIPAVTCKKRSAELQVRIASSVCCQCTRCTDLCPRQMLGYPVEPHKLLRSAVNVAEQMPMTVLNASLCCNCGICDLLACCQGISPRAVIASQKKILSENRIRYTAKGELKPDPQRESRMIPSSRWKEVLGVARFDKLPTYIEDAFAPRRVEILLRQHIGAPSVPLVAVGDKVTVGQKIAEAAEGLSIPQYASIDGTVTLTDDKKIVIEGS